MWELERRLRGRRRLLFTLKSLCAIIALLSILFFLRVRRDEWSYSPGVWLLLRGSQVIIICNPKVTCMGSWAKGCLRSPGQMTSVSPDSSNEIMAIPSRV